jgi:polysaccharide deacetylase family protein (PEP-CTERM system associated)
MKNVLTIDLEDYYHATAFSANCSTGSHLSRVEQNAGRILDLLAKNGCLATFFTVGLVAEKFPGLIQRIIQEGHEVACHSYAHRQVFTLTREQFYEDTHRAKSAIEGASGMRILGYRAPSFSFTKNTEWAFEVLAELGFSYDSSIFPIKHLAFEMQNAPRHPFIIATRAGSILEFPMSTLQILGSRAPVAGGAYLRLLPYWHTRWGIRYLNSSEGHPVCVYVHPWEFDPDQPRMEGSFTSRMRHYFGLRGAEEKFQRLLQDFEFQPMGPTVHALNNASSQNPKPDLPRIVAGELSAYAIQTTRTRI